MSPVSCCIHDPRFCSPLDYCDLVPRESLTDSPPSEFNLSDDDHDDNEPQQPMNFTEHAPSELAKPLPVKYGSDKYLVDAFANTILHILEIKCSDPQVSFRSVSLAAYNFLCLSLVPLFKQRDQSRTRSNPPSRSVSSVT